MFLRRLILEDYRQFYGRQEVDLSIDFGVEKNVVLVGGLNGAGKTSVLEGLQLALFGPQARHLWADRGYDEFIRDALNRERAGEGSPGFRLTVELETEAYWGMTLLTISRQWLVDFEGRVQHALDLREDDQPVPGDEEDWEDYIQARFPSGIAPFFFFDGEKIQTLAGDEDSEERLGEAIKRLLNLQPYETLEADLITYERNLRREATREDSATAQVDAQISAVDDQLGSVDERRHNLEAQIAENDRMREAIKDWIIRQGSRVALQRLELERELERCRRRKEELQAQLAQFVGQTLPVAILSPLMDQLQAQLVEEEDQERDEILRHTVQERRSRFLSQLPELPGELLQSVQAAWDQAFPPPEAGTQRKRIHTNLSAEDRRHLLVQLESMQTSAGTQIGELVDQMDTVEREIRRLIVDTKSIPDDPAFKDKEEERRELDQAIGAARHEIGTCEVERKDLENRKKALERERERLLAQAVLAQKNELKVQRAAKTRAAIRAYIEKLKEQKLGQVAYHLTTMFRKLHRKAEYIEGFAIDPKSLRVTMTTKDGRVIEKRQLSAGEKEIYAISLLWALAKTSQQDLPVVIDTPLGRLDSVHREHIAKLYLPEANRQVVLLSTDTEIDQALYEAIRPFVAKTQTLLFDQETGRTYVRDGYLWGGT